ncbi:MAG: histidine phosphatase family protein, partial [Actinomycetota bacterium]
DQEFRDFARTAINAVERTSDANPGRTVAAVCHGGVINTYLADLLDIDRPMFFEPSYTGITRLRAARNGLRSLVSVNETPHLRGVGLTPTPGS